MTLTQAEKDRIIAAVEAVSHGTVTIEVHGERNRIRILREEGEWLRDGIALQGEKR